jgi:homoserine dehydrogenase
VTESPTRVGLIGFGHVGRALARLLQAKRGQLDALLGITVLRDHPAGGSAAVASRLR